MITSTNLNALRNLEHFQVMSNVLSYLKEEFGRVEIVCLCRKF